MSKEFACQNNVIRELTKQQYSSIETDVPILQQPVQRGSI